MGCKSSTDFLWEFSSGFCRNASQVSVRILFKILGKFAYGFWRHHPENSGRIFLRFLEKSSSAFCENSFQISVRTIFKILKSFSSEFWEHSLFDSERIFLRILWESSSGYCENPLQDPGRILLWILEASSPNSVRILSKILVSSSKILVSSSSVLREHTHLVSNKKSSQGFCDKLLQGSVIIFFKILGESSSRSWFLGRILFKIVR